MYETESILMSKVTISIENKLFILAIQNSFREFRRAFILVNTC